MANQPCQQNDGEKRKRKKKIAKKTKQKKKTKKKTKKKRTTTMVIDVVHTKKVEQFYGGWILSQARQ